MKSKKNILILTFFICCCISSYAQKDSAFVFRIVLNPMNDMFGQHVVEVEHPFTSFSLRVGGGIIAPLFNSDGSNNYFPVYHGWMFNSSFIKNLKKDHFIQFTGFFKYKWYENILFEQNVGDQQDQLEWRESEIAKETGVKLLYGKRFPVNRFMSLETIFGLSYRVDFRSSVTNWSNRGWSFGVDHKKTSYPCLHIGLVLVLGDIKI